jgi:hypothetical protein
MDTEKNTVFRKGNKTVTLAEIIQRLENEGWKRERLISFSPQERKVFAEGSFEVALKVYYFLKSFIEKHNFEMMLQWEWAYTDMQDYLKEIPHLKINPFVNNYIERIFKLSHLIERHAKQKKNIPLDCLLYGARYLNIEPEEITEVKEDLESLDKEIKLLKSHVDTEYADTELRKVQIKLTGQYADLELLRRRLRDLGIADFKSKKSLKTRIYRANDKAYVRDIFELSFWLV